MVTQNLGYPRIGAKRELKRALENYWAGKIDISQLTEVSKDIRKSNWETQQKAGIDLIPCNDFSYYDQVLDMTLTLGVIPKRFYPLINSFSIKDKLDLYFAMARGFQKEEFDIPAMEMTKWFNTNYHYIVPEFNKDQNFKFFSSKVIDEFLEAKQLGIQTKPVLIGPVSYLLLGKEKETGFNKIDLIKTLVPVYMEILKKLINAGIEWVQLDEPFLSLDLGKEEKESFQYAYSEIRNSFPGLKIILATYFGELNENTNLALNLPVDVLHIDLARNHDQLDTILNQFPPHMNLSLGLVDGRNIWKNNYSESLKTIEKARKRLGNNRLILAPSCSLLHCPYDLENEANEKILPAEIKNWMAFSKQKILEVVLLAKFSENPTHPDLQKALKENIQAINSRKTSELINNLSVRERLSKLDNSFTKRKNSYKIRHDKQQKQLGLPLFPITTIGSFPQTQEIRKIRGKLKKDEITEEQYNKVIANEIKETILFQESIGIDVLVHGEFERNDMVEYFGEQLEGFTFTQNGWVQSYGSRAVKPPIIYGDVERTHPITTKWTTYAQSLSNKPVKGILTGPITMLQWSFVRDDQPQKETAFQIALAIREEVQDLEKSGIKIIQIDEPALREGLPLRKRDWKEYLHWAINAFKISSTGVKDETQIHTHMCYSEFNEIIENIADMDADVITIETSRSQMELLDAFVEFNYPNDIGPGIYDIHSPRVPSVEELYSLLKKAISVINPRQVWINPDCGLKTRQWEETSMALKNMVTATKMLRKDYIKDH